MRRVPLTLLLALVGFGSMFPGTLAGVQQVAASAPAGMTVDVLDSEHDLQAQLDRHPPGTTFILRSGTYYLSAPLIAKAHQALIGNGRVVLSGARVLTAFVRDGQRWFVEGQSQQGQVVGDRSICLPTAPLCAIPEDLFIDDALVTRVAALADLRPGTWYFDYANDRIYIADDPSGRRVETSVTPFAVGGHAPGVTLRSLIVEKFATPTHEAAVNGLGRGWTIEDLEVQLNHFAGIRTVDAATARGNRVHHNGAFGFIGAGDSVVIEANEIAYNNTSEYDPYWGGGGAKWVHTARLLVRGNYSHHNHGPGLWTDIDNVDVVYDSNRVEDNDLSGIFHEIGYRAIIRGNVVRRNGRGRPYPYWVDGAGILVVSSSDVEIYQNTVTDNWQGITALEAARGTGSRGPWVLARLYVHDNVVTQSTVAEPGSGRSGIAQLHGGTTAFTAAGNRFEKNKYYLGANGRAFFWMNREVSADEWKKYRQDVDGAILR